MHHRALHLGRHRRTCRPAQRLGPVHLPMKGIPRLQPRCLLTLPNETHTGAADPGDSRCVALRAVEQTANFSAYISQGPDNLYARRLQVT